MMRFAFAHLVAFVASAALTNACLATDPSLEWKRQFGTPLDDVASSVAADRFGRVYVAGVTQGSFGAPNAGILSQDVFVARFDARGNIEWTTQFGTSRADYPSQLICDEVGNVFLSGSSDTVTGSYPFLRKYDSNGNLIWARNLSSGFYYNYGNALSMDASGSLYLVGSTDGPVAGPNAGGMDAFVSKYDSDGNWIWSRQIGTPLNDSATSVGTDANKDVYVAGMTEGSIDHQNAGGWDEFLRKYDGEGNLIWSRQFGSSGDELEISVSTDRFGKIYVAGYTNGDLAAPNAGNDDAFIAQFDAAGNVKWIRQFGTPSDEVNTSIAADNLGSIYTSGWVGSLQRDGSLLSDAFVAKYDSQGNPLWEERFGTDSSDSGVGVSADDRGHIYVTGNTEGAFAMSNYGNQDAWVVKFMAGIPEPSTAALILVSLIFAPCVIRERISV